MGTAQEYFQGGRRLSMHSTGNLVVLSNLIVHFKVLVLQQWTSVPSFALLWHLDFSLAASMADGTQQIVHVRSC